MIRASFVLGSILSASVAASTHTATVETPSGLLAVAEPTVVILAETSILPLTNLAGETVSAFDGLEEIDVTKIPEDDHELTVTDEPALTFGLNPEDSVTATENQVKVYTDLVDYDPTDDDVDPDPITVTESDAKELNIGELADNDDVTMSESSAKEATKPGITASFTPSDAINQFRPAKNVTDTATTSEAIDRFDVTTEFDDTVTVTETSAKTITPTGKTDSVTMSGDNLKVFNSSVDFDPSDADVDPDPVSATDAINAFEPSLGKTDSLTMAESDAKDFTQGGINDSATASDAPALNPEIPTSDSVTAVEGIKNNPQLVKTDSVTASDSVNKFAPTLGKTDSVTTSESLDDFEINLTKTDSVTITDVSVKNFTENVDFDRSDADADADPVSITESLATNSTKPLSDSFTLAESAALNFTKPLSDSYSVTESIYTLLTLGESTYVRSDWVTMNDGDVTFKDSLWYYTIGGTDYYVPETGVIGAAELVNSVVINSDIISLGHSDNAGLVVNFHYTDVDDTTIGGYMFNQTPISAGAYS